MNDTYQIFAWENAVREKLRTCGDPNLVPLGNNLTDAQLHMLADFFEDSPDED